MLEGILVFAMLAGVLLAIMLLGQWGTRLQYTQMGARLLTFNAGDSSMAKFGRAGDQASQTFSSGTWDTLAASLPTGWLNTLFLLPNDRYSGSVKGVQRGRLPSQGPSMFDFSSASLGYHWASSAASNPWAGSGASVESTFLGIVWWIGHEQQTPETLSYIPDIPGAIPIVETIYGRVGIR